MTSLIERLHTPKLYPHLQLSTSTKARNTRALPASSDRYSPSVIYIIHSVILSFPFSPLSQLFCGLIEARRPLLSAVLPSACHEKDC